MPVIDALFWIGIAIAVIAVVFGVILVISPLRGASITPHRRSKRLQVGFGLIGTFALVTLWLAIDLALAIFPPLLIPFWIPLLTGNQHTSTRPKFLAAALMAGIVFLAVGTGLFWMRQ